MRHWFGRQYLNKSNCISEKNTYCYEQILYVKAFVYIIVFFWWYRFLIMKKRIETHFHEDPLALWGHLMGAITTLSLMLSLLMVRGAHCQ